MPLPLSLAPPLGLLVALALAPAPDAVELDAATWAALRPASPAEVAVPAWAASRTVQVTPVAGGVELRARWLLRSLSPGTWFSGHVLGDMPGLRLEDVRWDGKPVATAVGPDGVRVAGRVSGRATVEVVAFVPGDPVQSALTLRLMPATRGQVEASAPDGLVATLRLAEADPPLMMKDAEAPAKAIPGEAEPLALARGFWTGAAALVLGYGSPAASDAGAAVVVARAGIGVTVGDAELRGRARLVWEVRRGALEAVAFTADGVGADLEVTGPGVRAVDRSGAAVRVSLQAPVSGRLELDLRWTTPIAKAAETRAPLPQIRFSEVFRAESALQLARDGEVEAVPSTPGWTPISAAALPRWGQGLVEGTPSAAFTAAGAAEGSLELLRFVPIEGPPVVVDVAAYTIATSREGRALMRAHYEVRNERAASLRIRPPAGFAILGVRVAGETAVIARDREGGWRVPLRRSVDTVSGLLSFPVEVALLGEADPWDRRERRALPLPRLDAPVAATRVTLYLPPGYRSRQGPGEGEVVASFTEGEGITYGLGVGAVGAAQADALFQAAVNRWLANDFAGAQSELDRLKAMGASNENIARLQGNLDLIAGRGSKQDEGLQRRIREQAKARAVGEQVEHEKLKKQAEESRKSGDYDAAQRQYQAALAVGDRLAQLEQKESVEQQVSNEQVRSELKNVQFEGVVSKRAARQARRAVKFKTSRATSTGKDGKLQIVGGTAAVDKEQIDRDSDGFQDSEDATPTTTETTVGLDDKDAYGATMGERAADSPAGGEGQPAVKTPPAAGVKLGGKSVAAGPAAAENYTVDGADIKNLPAGSASAPDPATGVEDERGPVNGTSRDFTAIVDVSPTASRDAAEVRLTPQPAPVQESLQAMPGVAVGRYRLRGRRAGKIAARTPSAGPKPAETPPADEPPPAQAGLPAPQVTASAVAVVVPAVGEAVLYQRLLLPADAQYAVEVSAREPLSSRTR